MKASSGDESAEMKSAVPVMQQNWDDREFVEVVHLNIVRIAGFLNEFDLTVRTKIASLNEKLTKLERSVDFCEAAVRSTQDRLTKEQRTAR
jgi:chromosome 3 open reading frame 10